MIPDPNPTPGTTWPLHPAGSIMLVLWPTQLGLGFLETLETLVKIIEPAGCKGQVIPRVGTLLLAVCVFGACTLDTIPIMRTKIYLPTLVHCTYLDREVPQHQ